MTDTADPTTAETPPKRGRGRPPGAYGKYRPRLPEELKEPDELNPLAKKLNEAINSAGPELNSTEGQKRRKAGPLDNQKREAFARNVAKGMPTNQAYVAAGYCEGAADAASYVMIKHPDVAARIDELKVAAAKAALITPARVLEETAKIDFATVGPGADDGNLSRLSREQIGALNIKKGALGDLGKYLGMSKEKVEHSGPGGGPLQVDVLLNVLLTPANLERLSDIEVQSIRSAAAKLALPAPGPVIEGVIADAVTKGTGRPSADAAGAFGEDGASDPAGDE